MNEDSELINIEDKKCEPIKSLKELEHFFNNQPEWLTSVCELVLRYPDVVKYNGTGRCHYGPTEPIFEKRYNRNYVPKTLVCHDFRNGYLQDRFINGCKNEENGYFFDKWSHIDIFVYFSHHFITIPPLGWINLAHKHGVKILGTFITEWKEGKAFWNSIIDDTLAADAIEEKIIQLANDLAKLMSIIKIDGWLINIENPVSKPEYLLSFVKHLTAISHKMRRGSVIIWYDSVTKSGELKWQNELNSKNRCYFDACDGIFLNYNWTVEGLRRSAGAAMHRHLDVYAGLDVFGRGCYGNGRFHSFLAARETRDANVSLAIFAPAWTHETMEIIKDPHLNCQQVAVARFLQRDNAFWRSLGTFLYTHPIQNPFFTTFNTGVNAKRFDLGEQDIVLHRIPHSKEAHEEELNVETLLHWSCDCLQLHHEHQTDTSVVELVGGEGRVHRLLACNIPLLTSVTPLTLIAVSERPGEDNDKALLQVWLMVEDDYTGCRKQFLCTEEKRKPGQAETAIRYDTTIEEVICDTQFDVSKLKDFMQFETLDKCCVSAYNLTYDHGKIVDISLEIINGSKIRLRAFGIMGGDCSPIALKMKTNLS